MNDTEDMIVARSFEQFNINPKRRHMSKELKTKEDEKKEAEILELRERMLARVRAAISELESSTGDKTIDICQRFFADFAELHPDSEESGQLKQIADFLMDHLEKTQTDQLITQ